MVDGKPGPFGGAFVGVEQHDIAVFDFFGRAKDGPGNVIARDPEIRALCAPHDQLRREPESLAPGFSQALHLVAHMDNDVLMGMALDVLGVFDKQRERQNGAFFNNIERLAIAVEPGIQFLRLNPFAVEVDEGKEQLERMDDLAGPLHAGFVAVLDGPGRGVACYNRLFDFAPEHKGAAKGKHGGYPL